jgi:hypothetical protein
MYAFQASEPASATAACFIAAKSKSRGTPLS